MKKTLVILLMLSVVVGLSACGAPKESSASTAAPASTATPASTADPAPAEAASPSQTPSTASGEQKAATLSPEQLKSAEEFAAMADRFNGLVDKVNADENLSAMQGTVDNLNFISDAITQADTLFIDPASLNGTILADLHGVVMECNQYIDQMEALLKNYSGKETITIPVEIINDTGLTIYELAMSPQSDDSWGYNLLPTPLDNGISATTEMTFTKDTLVWDLLAVVDYVDADIKTVSFTGIDFTAVLSENVKLLLSVRDGIENGMYVAGFVTE